MVAYSYKRRFVAPIRAGLGLSMLAEDFSERMDQFGNVSQPRPKLQTIRAERKRHARPGEEIQHYCGMRTKHCFLIGRALCTEVRSIVLTFGKFSAVSIGGRHERQTHYGGNGLDDFARKDGFTSWREMVQFWEDEHGTLSVFIGVLIEWEPLTN